MRIFLLALLALLLTGAESSAEPQKLPTLSAPNDFITLSDVAAPEFAVMLMYPGSETGSGDKDKCGIAIRAHPFWIKAEDIYKLIAIDEKLGGHEKVENGQLVAKVQQPNLAADIFTIRTRSGHNLNDALGELDPNEKVEAVVSVIACN